MNPYITLGVDNEPVPFYVTVDVNKIKLVADADRPDRAFVQFVDGDQIKVFGSRNDVMRVILTPAMHYQLPS